MWGSGVRSWWVDIALFTVPKQIANLICYCSIAVACIWYIDFTPPALFGVSCQRICLTHMTTLYFRMLVGLKHHFFGGYMKMVSVWQNRVIVGSFWQRNSKILAMDNPVIFKNPCVPILWQTDIINIFHCHASDLQRWLVIPPKGCHRQVVESPTTLLFGAMHGETAIRKKNG